MKNDKKISIIIPVYNAEKYVAKCLNSIIGQTYKNLQIIVINDGSIDCSGKICEKFIEKDKRIELYHIKNGGSVVARKWGLEKAKGDYVGFVDADDYIEPNMFLELYNLMQMYDVDFVHSGYIEESHSEKKIICNYKTQLINLKTFQEKLKFIHQYIISGSEKEYITFSIWSKLFKADFIKKCYNLLPDEQQYGEDFLCLLECVINGKHIFMSQKTMYHYLIHENTLSHVNSIDYMIKEIGLWHQVLNILKKHKYLEILKEDIYYFLKRRMINILQADEKKKIKIPCYFYKNIKQIIGKRIVVFGAGKVGQDYYYQISKYQNCEIVSWVDSKWGEYDFDYADVKKVDSIVGEEFDIIIIAAKDEKISNEMKNILLNMGVCIKKIIWSKPGEYY